jgi:hypothetical protein
MNPNLIQSKFDYLICPNCGHHNIEDFCAKCGQSSTNFNKPIREIFTELFGIINLDKRIKHSLIPLLFKPGYLTLEYFKGHRRQYVPPMRLYLFFSFLFFFLTQINIKFFDDDVTSKNGKELKNELKGIFKPEKSKKELAIKLEEAGIDSTEFKEEIENLKEINDTIQKKANNISINTGSSSLDNFLKSRIEKRQDDFKLTGLTSEMTNYISYAMFFLLPLFAFFLRLLYIRSDNYYVHHLMFSINMHSFFFAFSFLLLLKSMFFGDIAGDYDNYLYLWILIYLFIGMKRVFKQGYRKTLLKMIILLFGYSIFLLAVIVFISIFAFFTY